MSNLVNDAILENIAELIIPPKHPNSSIRYLWDAMAGSGSGSEGNQSQSQGTGNQSQDKDQHQDQGQGLDQNPDQALLVWPPHRCSHLLSSQNTPPTATKLEN